MNWKRIFRAALCLLLVCCLVLHMSPLQVKAVDPVTIGMGIVAGIAGILGVGSLMIGLGVMPKPTSQGRSDFWNLAESIWNVLPDAFLVTCAVGNALNSPTMLKTFLVDGKYYVSTELVEFINKFLHTGTVSVNTSTGVVSSTAPVSRVPSFSQNVELALEYSAVLDALYAYDPDIYDIWVNAKYCTYVVTGAHGGLFIFSNESVPFSGGYLRLSDLDGYCIFKYSMGAWEHINLFGDYLCIEDPISITAEYRTALALQLGRVDPADIVDIGFRVEYVEDSTGGDNEEPKKQPVVVFKPPVSEEDVEDDDQDEVQDGVVLDPSVGIDPDTGYPVGTLSNRIQVAVDAEIAVASILVSLGISPGTTNTDFRSLVSTIISELPDGWFYNYGSLAYGELKLMRCWLCDGTYYFTGAVMEYINSLIYYGSDTMDPIFKDEGFIVDAARYPGYSDFISAIDVYRGETSDYAKTFVSIFDDSSYLGALWRSSDGFSYFVASPNPFHIEEVGSSQYIAGTGPYVYTQYYDGNLYVFSQTSAEDFRYTVNLYISLPTYYGYIDFYESGLSVVGDFSTFDTSPDLSDLLYQFISVLVDGIKVLFYPVKLFDALAQAEAALQEEVQAGLDSSTWITVNVETGEIIDVITNPEPDPGVDPDPTSPVPGPGTGGDPGTDTDSDPDPEPDPGTDPDDYSGLLSGLWEFFKWLGNFIVSGFRSIIEWLADTLVTGYRRVSEWLADTLLAGFRGIIESLRDAVLSGIREIFVPSDDFLSAKVESLRSRFGFADSIITTVAAMGAALNDFETEPPIIYMELSSAESKYDWGDRAIALDLRWYERYKPTVDALLSALLWVFFIWRVFRKLPGIISGMAGDSSFDSAGDGGSGGSRFDS